MEFLIWLACIIVSYILAKSKNRRGWAWALFAAFFFFLPLMILGFLKKKPAPRLKHDTSVVGFESPKVTPQKKVSRQPAPQIVKEEKQEPVFVTVTPPTPPLMQSMQTPPPLPMEPVTRINLNEAKEDEIIKLPGVNRILAKKIITIRDKVNGFETIIHFQSLLNLSDNQIDRIRPLVEIEKVVVDELRRGRAVDF